MRIHQSSLKSEDVVVVCARCLVWLLMAAICGGWSWWLMVVCIEAYLSLLFMLTASCCRLVAAIYAGWW
jgi:hypothetical protein